MVGKKSIFFTFLGIFVVTIMLIFVSIYTHAYYRDTMPATQMRFNIAEDFIESFENNFLPRGLHVISYDSLGAMIDVIDYQDSGTGDRPYFVSNIQDEVVAFEEAMLNGELNESQRCVPGPCVDVIDLSEFQNHTLKGWMNDMANLVWEALKLNMTYDVNNLELTQNESDGPWHVSVWLNLDYVIYDEKNKMTWTRDNITITARVPIEGFVDPFIRYQSNGTIDKVIRRLEQPPVMHAEDVKEMLDNGTFVHDPRSLSFLQRFGRADCAEGLSSSCCGMMSLVKASELNTTLNEHNGKLTTRSYADAWYYLPRCDGVDLYSVQGVSELTDYTPFRLNQYHISLLNIPPNETTIRSDAENNPCGEDDEEDGIACDMCSDNETLCGSVCVDLKTDIDNCNGCGFECDPGDPCIAGLCIGPVCGDGVVDLGEECDDSNTLLGDGCSATCEEEVAIIVHSIVCNAESDLPNMAGGPDITSTTAQNFVDANPNCDFESGWQFQWQYGVPPNPGDNVGIAGGWNTIGPTDGNGKAILSITSLSDTFLSMREVFQGGYHTFSSGSDVSAEFYCHNDVIVYDNLDIISGLVLGNVYYCVGFNALTVCGDGFIDAPTEQCDDGNTLSGDGCSDACMLECTDVDGDTFGLGCIAGPDCDDNDLMINPGETEGPIGDATCSDFLDNDCDGDIDAGDPGCAAICGNGIIELPETCDDGNIADSDGCSATCIEEDCYDCSGGPSICVTCASIPRYCDAVGDCVCCNPSPPPDTCYC